MSTHHGASAGLSIFVQMGLDAAPGTVKAFCCDCARIGYVTPDRLAEWTRSGSSILFLCGPCFHLREVGGF